MACSSRRLTPTISTPGAARAVQAAAARHRTTIGCHLKIDTGMNRLGFRHDNLRRTCPRCLPARICARRDLHALRDGGRAGEPPSWRPAQRDSNVSGRRLRVSGTGWAWLSTILACATRPTARHCCATRACGMTSSGPAFFSMGLCRLRWRRRSRSLPVMSLTSRVVAVKGLRAGESVGYGGRFQAETATHDRRHSGRLRRWPRHAAVRARPRADPRTTRADRRCRVDGHDHRRRHRRRRRGSGRRGGASRATRRGSRQQIDAREMAAAMGTIPWEVVCRIGTRIERSYT